MSNIMIVLVRKIVPNFWEVKVVEGPALQKHKTWCDIPHSSDMSLKDLVAKLPECTVLDVTDHFLK